MSRLALTDETQIPQSIHSKYSSITGGQSGLSNTYRALFANHQIASKLAELDDIVAQVGGETAVGVALGVTGVHAAVAIKEGPPGF